MSLFGRTAVAALALGFATLIVAPSAQATLPDCSEGSIRGAAPSDAGPMLDRAFDWIHRAVPYCQCLVSGSGGYRSDCSGLVSWAWKLPPPGRITTEFAPFMTDLTKAIAGTDLRQGDAVNNSDHVMLFKAWVTKPTKATFIEEPGCSSSTPYAHEFTATVTITGETVVVTSHGTFTAIRYPDAP